MRYEATLIIRFVRKNGHPSLEFACRVERTEPEPPPTQISHHHHAAPEPVPQPAAVAPPLAEPPVDWWKPPPPPAPPARDTEEDRRKLLAATQAITGLGYHKGAALDAVQAAQGEDRSQSLEDLVHRALYLMGGEATPAQQME